MAPRCEPQTEVEWQIAVDAANALLRIDAARQYGLIEGGPAIDVDRCVELIERGAARGTMPRRESVEEFVMGFNGELARQKAAVLGMPGRDG
jgi:hypothetical protein